LIAKYRFDDEFVSMTDERGTPISIDDSDIAHAIDEKKFVNNPEV